MALNTKIPQQVVQSTTTALSVKRGEPAMLVADLTKGTVVLMDGATYGGIPMAREDVQIRAGSDAITVNGKEWAPLLGNIAVDVNPQGFIDSAVSPSDKVLGVGDDGKITTKLTVVYDADTGLFELKGKDGETISSFTLVIPTGITPKSVSLVENPESQEPGLYLEFVFIDDDDVEIKLYANMDVLKDVYTAGRGIIISEDRVISVDEDAISGVIADDLIEENSGLKVENDKLHLDDHASPSPQYGLGDLDNYGHVRLADSGDSRATVQAGIAATPAAVQDVDDRAVHKAGDETISGTKTFVDTPKVTLPDGSTDDVASLTDVQMLVDGTVWAKRVDALPEDTDEITADMPEGALVVTPDDGVGSPIVALQAELDALKADVKKRGLYNQEVWITESGEWEVPVTGVLELTVIGGGAGAYKGENTGAVSGSSGEIYTRLLHLNAGDVATVTIGAGGTTVVNTAYTVAMIGGRTSFEVGAVSVQAAGGGINYLSTSGIVDAAFCAKHNAAGIYFPGSIMTGTANRTATMGYVGYGHGGWISAGAASTAAISGAIRLRYYDPNKENN